MLSSRYLYLHEALGLGPMWLNRDANPNVQSSQSQQAEIDRIIAQLLNK